MIITKEFLRKHNACKHGLDYWGKVNKPDLADFCNQALLDDHFDYANWLIVRLLKHKDEIRYAIHAAESVLPIWEAQYPDDKRPHEAIAAAKTVVENDNEETRAAAVNAANAAYAAAYTAGNAAYTAGNSAAAFAAARAAYAAAYTAGNAAFAAATAADAAFAAARATYSAAFAAADAAVKTAIISYGLKLIKDGEK